MVIGIGPAVAFGILIFIAIVWLGPALGEKYLGIKGFGETVGELGTGFGTLGGGIGEFFSQSFIRPIRELGEIEFVPTVGVRLEIPEIITGDGLPGGNILDRWGCALNLGKRWCEKENQCIDDSQHTSSRCDPQAEVTPIPPSVYPPPGFIPPVATPPVVGQFVSGTTIPIRATPPGFNPGTYSTIPGVGQVYNL